METYQITTIILGILLLLAIILLIVFSSSGSGSGSGGEAIDCTSCKGSSNMSCEVDVCTCTADCTPCGTNCTATGCPNNCTQCPTDCNSANVANYLQAGNVVSITNQKFVGTYQYNPNFTTGFYSTSTTSARTGATYTTTIASDPDGFQTSVIVKGVQTYIMTIDEYGAFTAGYFVTPDTITVLESLPGIVKF